MSRRLLILLAILALAVGVLTPVTAGAAEDSLDLDGSITPVEKSTTGSYIVVMTADPLLVEFDQDELDSNAATKKANGLAKGHDKALKDAGVSTDAKINEYVNALNGVSAVLSYGEAPALAAILAAYSDELANLGFADAASVLSAAASRAGSKPSRLASRKRVVLRIRR